MCKTPTPSTEKLSLENTRQAKYTTRMNQLLNPLQLRLLREQLPETGSLAFVANLIGVPLAALKNYIARDVDFKTEVDSLLELHSDRLYMVALQRAVGPLGSDMLLGRLLEAKHQSFNKAAQAAEVGKKGKPSGITLRTFEATADGAVVDAEPREPLRLSYRLF